MKKLGLMILVLLFTGMGMVNAQQPQTPRKPMQQYVRTEILPVVKTEQAKLIQALTAQEKQELTKIKAEMKTFRAQGKQIRESMNGNFNQQVWDTRKAALDAIKVKADKLVAAHPKAARAYKEAVDKVLAQIPQRPMGVRGGQRPMRANGMSRLPKEKRINRLSDPAFALLMDTENMGVNGRGMNPNNGNRGLRHGGMRGQQAMRRQRMMNHRAGMQAGLRVMRNPEVRAKIEAYAKENIFPVLSKERKAFDSQLNNKEKKQIAAARKQWEARRALMQKRMQDPNFVPGQGMNDSTRLAMRLEMEKTMLPVREIALRHYTELKSVLTQIKGQSQQWRADIRDMVRPQNQGPRPMNRRMANKPRRNGAILFLMYNPANPQLPFMK